MSGARWGAGFAAAGRFVAEIEAAAAGKGTLRPGYVLAGDEVFLLDRCRAAVLKAFVPAGAAGFLPLRSRSGLDLDLRGARPRADALADGAVPGDLCAQRAPALHARRQEGRVCGAGSLFPLAESAGAAAFCRRLPAHPLRRAAHGDGRQESLRAADGNAGRALRHGGTGARERGRRDALGGGHGAGGRACAWNPMRRASWWTRWART